jgi:hypothetical protein
LPNNAKTIINCFEIRVPTMGFLPENSPSSPAGLLKRVDENGKAIRMAIGQEHAMKSAGGT